MSALLDVVDGGLANMRELRQLPHAQTSGLPSLKETFAELFTGEEMRHE